MIEIDEQNLCESRIDEQVSLFAYSNCDTDLMPNKNKTSKKALLFSRILIYTIIAIMLCLYLNSISIHIKYKLRLSNVLTALFPIAVCCLILILSAHNLWGKLASFAVKHKAVQSKAYRHNKSNIEALSNAEMLDKLRKYDTAIYVYKDIIIIKDYMHYKKIKINDILRVEIDKKHDDFCVQFILCDDKFSKFKETIPNKLLGEFKSCFDCKVIIKSTPKSKEQKAIEFKQKLPIALFTLIFVVAGIAMIIANKLKVDIPLFLGLFFVLGGTIAFCGAVGNSSEVMVSVVVPTLFSSVFLVFPIGFLTFIMNKSGVSSVFTIFAYMPLTIVLVMFISLGVLGFLTAMYKLIKIIKR